MLYGLNNIHYYVFIYVCQTYGVIHTEKNIKIDNYKNIKYLS